MRVSILLLFLVFFFAGCDKQSAAARDAQAQARPGYQTAKTFCSQCHDLPSGDQYPPAAWPYVVSRMEGHMEAAHKRIPSAAEHDAIIGYLQSK